MLAVLLVWFGATDAWAIAQQQFAELGKRHLPFDEDLTSAVACGDVDGDGDLDLVVGKRSTFGSQNRLYVNDGTGTFIDATATRMPAMSSVTTCVALGDVDGDGDLDLVVGNGHYHASQNLLYLNDGSGTFTDATATQMPAWTDSTTCVVLGDVDGDGDLDLVVGNEFGERNRLYVNDGAGVFTDATATRMPAHGDDTRAVALGDVDGDGDLDLVVGNGGTASPGQQNRLYVNDGTGRFTDATATRMPADQDETGSVALGDVDGDGDLDLLVGNGGYPGQQNRLYRNDGTGRFTDATATQLPMGQDGTRSVALGDVDGDGDLDLLVGNGGYPGQQDRLYLNDGTGRFTDATATRMPVVRDDTWSVALGDVDSDRDLDLVVANSGQDRLHWNDGTGSFHDATAAPLPVVEGFADAVALGDVDGDGDLDLMVARQNRFYRNDGRGIFTDATATRLPVVHDNRCVALGDVDGDGDLDLVLGNLGQNGLWQNDGTGTFTDVTATRMPADGDFTTSVALGDVDGDGDLDVVFGNEGQQNRLYLNDGTGTLTDATGIRMPVDSDLTRAVVLGDVDGDGDLDLVTGNIATQNRLYGNDGTGTFIDATATQMPVDNDFTLAVVLGDLDWDGDPDLVVGNGWQHQNRLYQNDGAGTFLDVTATHLPVDRDHTTSLALGDVDGDGDLDLVLGNGAEWSRERNRLYLNDGAGMLTDATATRMPVGADRTPAVVLGDLDGDGDLDLVVGGNRLHQNLLRQLDAPYLLRVGRDYRLDVYARHGPPRLVDVALPCLSLGTASLPLPPLGTLGIDPNALLPLPAFVIPQPLGVGSVVVTVPHVPGLAGISVHGQALLIQYPTQDRLTNVTADVVLR